MKTYTHSQQVVELALRRFKYGFATLGAVIVLATVVLTLISTADLEPEWKIGNIIANFSGVGLGLVLSGFLLLRQYKQRRKELERPLLEFGEDKIARPAYLYPRVEISRSEVTAIQEIADGLCVIADNPRRAVLVPKKLEPADYQSIRSTLTEWMPFTEPSAKSRWIVWAWIAGMVLGGGLFCFSWSLWVVIPVSIAFIGLFGYTLWYIRGSIKTSPRLFFTYVFSLLIISAIIAGKIWLTVAMINGGF